MTDDDKPSDLVLSVLDDIGLKPGQAHEAFVTDNPTVNLRPGYAFPFLVKFGGKQSEADRVTARWFVDRLAKCDSAKISRQR